MNEKDLLIDLESGARVSEEGTSKNDLASGSTQLNYAVSRVVGLFMGPSGSTVGDCGVNSCSNVENLSDVANGNVELLIDKISGEESEENASFVDKKHFKKKCKKTNLKKASKPPRPPRGPSLDATDMKLVKEISELAMKKRARIERMRALKKMRAAKSSSSSNSSLAAMIITILFFVVIIFQGVSSRSSSSLSSHGSPEAAVAREGLISIQFFRNFSTTDSGGSISESPNSVGIVSGSESRFPG